MFKSGIDWLRNPFAVMSKKHAQLGLSFPLRLPQLDEVLVTGDPLHIKQLIAQKQFNAGEGIRVLSHFLGKRSVICLDGEIHQQRHMLLSKYLYSDKIFLLDEKLHQICQQQLARVEKSANFNFYRFSQHVLLEIAILQILGVIEEKYFSQLKSSIQAVYDLNIHPMLFFLKPLQLKCFGWSSWGRLIYHQKQIRSTLRQILHSNHFGTDSLLYFLTQHGLSHYTNEEELIDELMALLFFTHETTAATISTVADFIVGHDPLIERVQKDSQLLQACIKESMRLRPVVPHLTRISRMPQQIGDFKLHQGQWLFPSSYLAHFNEIVFPESESFLPDRFLPDKDYPYSCFPFGIGERVCLGKKLANRHMEIILTEILTALRFQRHLADRQPSKRQFVLMIPLNTTVARVVENRLSV